MRRGYLFSMPLSARKAAGKKNKQDALDRAAAAASDVALQMAASSDQVQPMEIDDGMDGGASPDRECHCFPSQLLDSLTFLSLYSMPVAIQHVQRCLRKQPHSGRRCVELVAVLTCVSEDL